MADFDRFVPPPRELVPIFNAVNYVVPGRGIAGGDDKEVDQLTFPRAQGTMTFPNGVEFGDGTAQTKSYTGYTEAAGTYVNASPTLNQNGEIIRLVGGSEQGKYHIDWKYNNTTLSSNPEDIDFIVNANPGKLLASNPANPTTGEPDVNYELPQMPNVGDGVTSVNQVTAISFPDDATVTAVGNIASIDVVSYPNVTGPGGVSVTRPPIMDISSNIEDVTVTSPSPGTATVTISNHSGAYVQGQGYTYTFTDNIYLNYNPSALTEDERNALIAKTQANPMSMYGQTSILIPIYQIIYYYNAGGSQLIPEYGYVSNFQSGEQIRLEWTESVIQTNEYAAGTIPQQDNNNGGAYIGGASISPELLIANYQAWRTVVPDPYSTYKAPDSYPMTTTSYENVNGTNPGQSTPWFGGYLTGGSQMPGGTAGLLGTNAVSQVYPPVGQNWYNSYYLGSAQPNTSNVPGPAWWGEGYPNTPMYPTLPNTNANVGVDQDFPQNPFGAGNQLSGVTEPRPQQGYYTAYSNQVVGNSYMTFTVDVVAAQNVSPDLVGIAQPPGRYVGGLPDGTQFANGPTIGFSGFYMRVTPRFSAWGIEQTAPVAVPNMNYISSRNRITRLSGGTSFVNPGQVVVATSAGGLFNEGSTPPGQYYPAVATGSAIKLNKGQ